MTKSILTISILAFAFGTELLADSLRLKSFYNEYMSNVMEGRDNDSLCRSCMSEDLIMKLKRIIGATGADPVIRAQDVNGDALKTLSVKDLGDDWYMVEYRWDEDRPETTTRIPVKATTDGDRCSIVYIVPEWKGVEYGDSLIYNGNNDSDIMSGNR